MSNTFDIAKYVNSLKFENYQTFWDHLESRICDACIVPIFEIENDLERYSFKSSILPDYDLCTNCYKDKILLKPIRLPTCRYDY